MKENVGPLRRRIASNLRLLLSGEDQSPVDVAAAAKVDRKTVNNLLNARFDPRVTQVEKVASAFGLEAWQLMASDLGKADVEAKQLAQLIKLFVRASPEGRAAILHVAGAVTTA